MPRPLKLELARNELLRELADEGITDERVLGAMADVPREAFVARDFESQAYENAALPVGDGQTISQPYIVALMTQSLALQGHERVLEIGTGTGYQAAILARLAAEVFTIERIESLAESARARLERLGVANVRFRIGDGTLGWPEEAPFDRIIVTAAGPDVPATLLSQLADHGILVIPVGTDMDQALRAYTREGGQIHWRHLCSCRFVHLIGKEGWHGEE